MKFMARLEEWLLAIVMAVISLITFINVISRYLLNTSFSFTEELTTNLFAYAIFIGAALLARENGHLGFSLLTDLLPKKLRMAAVGLTMLLSILFFGILLYYGWDMVVQQKEYAQTSPAMGLPEWWLGMAVPLGALLCLIRFTEGFVKEIKVLKGGSHD